MAKHKARQAWQPYAYTLLLVCYGVKPWPASLGGKVKLTTGARCEALGSHMKLRNGIIVV